MGDYLPFERLGEIKNSVVALVFPFGDLQIIVT